MERISEMENMRKQKLRDFIDELVFHHTGLSERVGLVMLLEAKVVELLDREIAYVAEK